MVVRDPYAVPGQYRKAQLHCHTTESDGKFRPDELLQMYKADGYSFVCITDHNRVTRHTALDSDEFLTIPGTEDTVTRWFRPLGPHMSRLFVRDSLESGTAQERVDRTISEGGVAGLCHLSWTGNLWTGSWSSEAVRKLRGYRLLEIWNPHSDPQEDIKRWEIALRAHGPDQQVWGVAVDDCHRADKFNRGWIMVKVPQISAQALRQALAIGSFYASTGPQAEFSLKGSLIRVEVRPSTYDLRPTSVVVRFIDQRGKIRSELHGWDAEYAVHGDEGYVRVEVHAGRGRAWSQPFWIAART